MRANPLKMGRTRSVSNPSQHLKFWTELLQRLIERFGAITSRPIRGGLHLKPNMLQHLALIAFPDGKLDSTFPEMLQLEKS